MYDPATIGFEGEMLPLLCGYRGPYVPRVPVLAERWVAPRRGTAERPTVAQALAESRARVAAMRAR